MNEPKIAIIGNGGHPRTLADTILSKAIQNSEEMKLLQAYLDTGLTPEEICKLNARMPVLLYQRENLAEYLKAEEQGLLIKLPPCEVGDIIFEVDRPEYGIIYCEVTRIYFVKGYVCGVKSNGKFRQTIIEVSVVEGHGKDSAYHFTDDEFGKLVFFTKEEAEEALKGGSL